MRQLGKTLKNASRLRTIVAVFARHGFHNIAEKIKLGRFILEKFSSEDLDLYTAPQRLRMAFEQLGPTFVKLGQLLATRPDLVPKEFVEEFKKFHDQVQPLPFSQIEEVLIDHYGSDYRSLFSEFSETPLASASIAQVHWARLQTGEDVVVKVQRPGVSKLIENDLSILYNLAELLEHYVPEIRIHRPKSIVDEFFKTMSLETNFLVEGNNIRRFEKNFNANPDVKIPHLYQELSGRRVLVMEALKGIPLSHIRESTLEGYKPDEVVRKGLKCYLKMVFIDGFFHGDLHAGNIFILPDNQIGLVDFGVVGRLGRKTKDIIANMMLALSVEDYERLAYEFVDMAPFSGYVDVDLFARELRDLMSPYHGLSTKNVNFGKLLLDSTAIATRHRLSVPTELMLFFKSVVTIEGMGRTVIEDFDLLTYVLDMASDIVEAKYEPARIVRDLTEVARDSTALLYELPRQIRQLIRRVNNPDFSVKLTLNQMDDLTRAIEIGSQTIFFALIIGSLILGSSILILLKETHVTIPIASMVGFAGALLLSLVVLFRKSR